MFPRWEQGDNYFSRMNGKIKEDQGKNKTPQMGNGGERLGPPCIAVEGVSKPLSLAFSASYGSSLDMRYRNSLFALIGVTFLCADLFAEEVKLGKGVSGLFLAKV